MLGCKARAEDIVQDAFLRFSDASARSRRAGVSIVHPVAYLYRTVRNLALNASRRLRTERNVMVGGEMLEAFPSATPTPEHEALFRDELRVMEEALAELPERTRRAFELHRIGGYTLQKVADTLGISVGLVHQLVRDALTHCAERLDDGA